MEEQPVRYAVLRDRNRWDTDAGYVGLEPLPDGALTLARLPGTADGRPNLEEPPAQLIEFSGLAVGECQTVYAADTAHQRILRHDSLCQARTVLPGEASSPPLFEDPRGLLILGDSLYVADPRLGCVMLFRLPELELQAVWETGLTAPATLAADSQRRIYVLDGVLVLRFSGGGQPDAAYNLAMAANLAGLAPFSIAVGAGDILFISDILSNQVLSFSEAGQQLDCIRGAGPQQPRALAALGSRLYVGDQASGTIWACDAANEAYPGQLNFYPGPLLVFPGPLYAFSGPLNDYRGPATALAVDPAGTLYIKPGLDESYWTLRPGLTYAAAGILTAGPYDAGEGAAWERLHAEVDAPEGTHSRLRFFTNPDRNATPDWNKAETLARALDTLLAAPNRYLWLEVELSCDPPSRATPSLLQVQAATTAPSYIRALPAVYARDDAATHFLEHWLALFHSELNDLELNLADLPRRFDPQMAPEDGLGWLASWLAFVPPAGLSSGELRALLQRVHSLYERRGTPGGILEFIELYTGVRPTIFESFRERHIWQLGYTSTLGFDTALAAGLPDGMLVSGDALADRQYAGLRGDYYSGIDFRTHVLSRIDPYVDFDWKTDLPKFSNLKDYFSVRWTGQLLPRYSERYTFHVLSDDDVRLYIDGVLIIDKRINQPPSEHSSAVSVEIEAERWYSIQLEYFRKLDDSGNAGTGKTSGGNAINKVVKLYWSSRSQPKEIIPQSRLYSNRDETVRMELPPAEADAGGMEVGQAVVGESGPQEKSDFGLPLFSETAHLFTVILPASALPDPAQRELLRQVIEAEKPAHTDYHLCFVEPNLRVGFQARLGIDSIVAGPPPPIDLEGASLGLDTYLGDEPGDQSTSRVGKQTHLGQDTRIS